MIKNQILKNNSSLEIEVKSSKYGRQVVYLSDLPFENNLLSTLKSIYVWGTIRHSSLYAMCIDSNNKSQRLHRLLFPNLNPKQLIDHIDHNALNNRRENLRVVSHKENNKNAIGNRTARTSNYKGVHFHKASNKWKAQIQVNKKKISLGTHETEVEAAIAYNAAAKKYFSDYAVLNQLDESVKILQDRMENNLYAKSIEVPMIAEPNIGNNLKEVK